MPAPERPHTARIYQFPLRARGALAGERPAPAADHPPRPATVVGSGWYHDEAIRESAAPDHGRPH